MEGEIELERHAIEEDKDDVLRPMLTEPEASSFFGYRSTARHRIDSLFGIVGASILLAGAVVALQRYHQAQSLAEGEERQRVSLPSLIERAQASNLVSDATFFACGLSCSKNEPPNFFVQTEAAESTGRPEQSKQAVTYLTGVAARASHSVQVKVFLGEKGQQIEGFGGAFTESSALVFASLSKGAQQTIVDRYWGPHGIGYSLGRVHINSCDFSKTSYAFHDEAEDFELDSFDRKVEHDQAVLIPFIKRAQDAMATHHASLKLLATPWSPPAWMKENRRMTCAEADLETGPCSLRESCYSAWAKYISLWISAYENHGIPIWAITPQNEPYSTSIWEAMRWDAEAYSDWLGGVLGPLLQKEHPHVKVFVYDDNKDSVYRFAETVYEHSTASGYASGVAFHWYKGDHFDELKKVRAKFPQAQLLATEACYESAFRDWDAQSGNYSFGEGYAHDIIGDLNAGSTGWIDWNLMLDMDGGPNHVGNTCDSPLLCSPEASTHSASVYAHPQLFYVSHFSVYILPDSFHLKTEIVGSTVYKGPARGYGVCTADDGLQATAAIRPDRKIAVVVLNCGDSGIDFTLSLFPTQGDAKAVDSSIPAHAIRTYVLT